MLYYILNGISKAECKKGVLDEYGQRYTVDIEIENNFKKQLYGRVGSLSGMRRDQD